MIYLHVGVHKTASTYLQSLFAANQGKMAANGRAYWILWQLRGVMQELQAARHWTEAGLRDLRTQRTGPAFRLRDLTDAAQDCLLSDENIVGWSTHATGGQFYPRAAKRLGRIGAVLHDHEIEVWLCVRAYDRFLSSVYCETLRGGHFTPWAEFEARYQPLPAARWPALVDAIRKGLPGSRVVVWAYEDFRALLPEIASRLSGIPYDRLHHLAGDERPSPSAEAIRRHCENAASMTPNQRTLSVAMCEELYPLSAVPEKFNPWRPEAIEAMTSTYREDLTDIGQRPYVEFLTPR